MQTSALLRIASRCIYRNEFPDFDVDCEYNRDGVAPKKIGHLGLYPDDDDTEAETVFPDIIVHRRGTEQNYLVIEAKKSTRSPTAAAQLPLRLLGSPCVCNTPSFFFLPFAFFLFEINTIHT